MRRCKHCEEHFRKRREAKMKRLEEQLAEQRKQSEKKLVYRVDIDGTICTWDGSGEYKDAKPRHDQIAKINRLYDAGHTIIYWTSRGMTTGLDWFELTKGQLIEWGAKHHSLEMKKPFYDRLICDKSCRIEEL